MWKNLKIKRSAALSTTLIAILSLTACAASGQRLSGEVQQQGKNLSVRGESTLPEKSLILVSLIDPSQPADMNRNVIVQEFALLKAGHFETTLKPLVAVKAGKYQLRLRFSPPSVGMASQAEVLAAVGEHGEKLSGPQVTSVGDVKMLEHQQEIEYKP